MNNTTQTETSATVHPFTARGLGQAPFRFVGMEMQDLCYGQAILNRAEYERTGIALTTAPGGSCAYCGTYIVNMFNVESADGNKFHVGSDCVAKIAPSDPVLARAVDTIASKAKKLQTDGRNAAKISALVAQLAQPEVRAALASKPHPLGFRGQTLLDSVEWMMQHSGTAGRLKTSKVVALALAPEGSCRYCGKPEACSAEKPCRGLRAAWARDERQTQRCENEEARRFEDRAYGRD